MFCSRVAFQQARPLPIIYGPNRPEALPKHWQVPSRLGKPGKPRSAVKRPATGGSGSRVPGIESAPWALLFDLRERETEWLEGNQIRLVVAFAAQELRISKEEVMSRLQDLAILLPDTSAKISKLSPEIVADLIGDTQEVARKLVQLKSIFPKANLDIVVAGWPGIMNQDLETLQLESAKVADMLGVSELDTLVEEYPRILDSEAVQEALEMLQRLMPSKDPRETLVATPSFMTRVESGVKRLGTNLDPGTDHKLD